MASLSSNVSNVGASPSSSVIKQIRMSEAKDNWKPLRKIASQPAEKYRIGTIGDPWEQKEKDEWLAQTTVYRSYMEEVVEKLNGVDRDVFEVRKYGSIGPQFPLMAAVSKNWDASKPSVLVTGGVHGYETSGVQGAILFLTTSAAKYTERFNVVVCPCVSPWGYERVERWNSKCLVSERRI